MDIPLTRDLMSLARSSININNKMGDNAPLFYSRINSKPIRFLIVDSDTAGDIQIETLD